MNIHPEGHPHARRVQPGGNRRKHHPPQEQERNLFQQDPAGAGIPPPVRATLKPSQRIPIQQKQHHTISEREWISQHRQSKCRNGTPVPWPKTMVAHAATPRAQVTPERNQQEKELEAKREIGNAGYRFNPQRVDRPEQSRDARGESGLRQRLVGWPPWRPGCQQPPHHKQYKHRIEAMQQQVGEVITSRGQPSGPIDQRIGQPR